MPLYKTLTNRDQSRIYIWNITESEAGLRTGIELSLNSMNRLSKMSSDLHRRGFLSIRHLLRIAGYSDLDLSYDDNGKPHLNDGKYISITHSFEFTAIIVSDIPVGIDIEKQREKIKRIAHKFVGQKEDFVLDAQNSVPLLSVLWCVKESMYKQYGQKGLSFKQHCLVKPFSMKDQSTHAYVNDGAASVAYEVFFEPIENFMMAYVLPTHVINCSK